MYLGLSFPLCQERRDETPFTTKTAGNLSPSYFTLKLSFPVLCLMANYAETGRSGPPNPEALWITLLVPGI
jgi:hypothetical protein